MKNEKLLADLVDHMATMLVYCDALESRIPEAELHTLRSTFMGRDASSAPRVRLTVKDSRGH